MKAYREWPAHVRHRHGAAPKRADLTTRSVVLAVFDTKSAGAQRALVTLAQHVAGDHSRARRNRAV